MQFTLRKPSPGISGLEKATLCTLTSIKLWNGSSLEKKETDSVKDVGGVDDGQISKCSESDGGMLWISANGEVNLDTNTFYMEDEDTGLRFRVALALVRNSRDPHIFDLDIWIFNECKHLEPMFKNLLLKIMLVVGEDTVLKKDLLLEEDTRHEDENLFHVWTTVKGFCARSELTSCGQQASTMTTTSQHEAILEVVWARVSASLLVKYFKKAECSPSESLTDEGNETGHDISSDHSVENRPLSLERPLGIHECHEVEMGEVESSETENYEKSSEDSDEDSDFDESPSYSMCPETMDSYMEFLRAGSTTGFNYLFHWKPDVNLELLRFAKLCSIPNLWELAAANLLTTVNADLSTEFLLEIWNAGGQFLLPQLEVKAVHWVQRKLAQLPSSQIELELKKVREFARTKRLTHCSLENLTRLN